MHMSTLLLKLHSFKTHSGRSEPIENAGYYSQLARTTSEK
jgi:hypothetical protein